MSLVQGVLKFCVQRKKLSAVVLLALLTRFSQRFRRGVILGIISTEAGVQFALWLSRFLLGKLLPPILVHWWFVYPGHISHDRCQVLHNLDYTRNVRYGPHERERLDTLLPLSGEVKKEVDPLHSSNLIHFGLSVGKELAQFAITGKVPEQTHPREDHHVIVEDAPAILFGHGGGWVCDGTDVQLQQLTPIARAGYAIYSYNYPLAPDDRFPGAIISTLRALNWLKTERDVDEVSLLGESAGGNLVTFACALLHNRKLFEALAEEVDEPICDWEYPKVLCVCSWYSILCSGHWKGAGWLSVGLERVFELYLSEEGVFGNRVTLVDLEEDLEEYPPALFIAGETDPLGLTESSRAAHTMLSSKSLQSELHVYEGSTHGFCGYPIQMQAVLAGGDYSDVEAGAIHAVNRTIDFLKKHHPPPV